MISGLHSSTSVLFRCLQFAHLQLSATDKLGQHFCHTSRVMLEINTSILLLVLYTEYNVQNSIITQCTHTAVHFLTFNL